MWTFYRKKEKGEEQAEPKGFLSRLREGLSKTRTGLAGRLDNLLYGKKQIDEKLLEQIEEILFTSDLGVAATRELIETVQAGVARKELDQPEKLRKALKEQIRQFLDVVDIPHSMPGPGEPYVIMVIGVNGVGKTTTIAKLGYQAREQGKTVIFVAGDTFRAAAIEQLQVWGDRVGVEVIKQKQGSDPSAVVFDGLSSALAKRIDVVLIDTAGRLHTKSNLMEELEKINRVIKRKLPGAPHEVWLVLDATTGQNAVSQAEIFHKALGLTGIILTKLDGTAKGGIVVGICRQMKIPIKFIGIGEKMDDLRPFNAPDFVDAIFG
ncbi:MAG: signal recognition particle-docking protein FtsY [Deltaproteobacteria bacterium]|nr:signal recognition particle-docking protein FtsY [Deltaproteobacteria bacterium]